MNLFNILENEDWESLRAYIDAGEDVNLRDPEGTTALFQSMPLDCLQSLIEKGVDINIKDNHGATAIFENGSIECTQFFINAGIDIHHRDNEGATAIFYDLPIECIRLLIDEGADVNQTDNEGATALFYEIQPECTMLLVDRGADVNHKDDEGTAAIFRQEIEYVRSLIDAGADVNATNQNGSNALLSFSQTEDGIVDLESESFYKLLLESNCDVNALDSLGCTALHLACFFGKVEHCRLLIEQKVDIDIKNKNGKTALNFAMNDMGDGLNAYDHNGDHDECVRIVIMSGAKFDRLCLDVKFHPFLQEIIEKRKTAQLNLLKWFDGHLVEFNILPFMFPERIIPSNIKLDCLQEYIEILMEI